MSDILLIEDDLNLRKQIEQFLEKNGHQVVVATDIEEGLNLLLKSPLDIVITDVKLPGRPGTVFLQEMALALPVYPPVIVITGHADKNMAIQALRYGAFDFIEKPLSPPILERAIQRALMAKQQEILKYKAYLSNSETTELTEREKEVAYLAAEGLSNEEIGDRLTLGTETIKSHLKKIFRKLGVSNRAALSNKLKDKSNIS